jgi:membrane protein
MILCVAFMLLVSLTLSTVIAVVGKHIDALMPAGWTRSLLQTAHFILSFGIIALLFAAIYQVLPDVRITWRNVFFGAFSTAFLFVIGKELIGYYLGNSHVGSAYGVASSLAILLVWVYYSSMILFFGAELTKSWVRLRGNQIRPEKGAVLVQHEIKRISVDEYEKQLEGDEVNA